MITLEGITAISDEYGFRPDVTEQFLMDYVVHQRVTGGVRCVTKGGMCMPFYQAGGALQRLSVDVDLATKTQARDVESAVKLASGIPNVTAVDKHTPSRQTVLKNNLVTYYVHYRSCFGQEARRIKVDFLYDLGMNYDTRIMPAGKGIVGVKIPHDMEILARSSLMADKVGALATGTIGLEASKVGEIAKQVFDVGILLDRASVDDIAKFFAEFDHMLEMEKTINCKAGLTAGNVVDSIQKALDRMLVTKHAVQFTQDAKKGYLDFHSTYISKSNPYGRIDHYVNILYVSTLNLLMRQVLDGKNAGDAAAEMQDVLVAVGSVTDYKHVQSLYGRQIRDSTGMPEKYMERMDARLSCLLCAHAALGGQKT